MNCLVNCGVHSLVHITHSFDTFPNLCKFHEFNFYDQGRVVTMKPKARMRIEGHRKFTKSLQAFFFARSLHLLFFSLFFSIGALSRAVPQTLSNFSGFPSITGGTELGGTIITNFPSLSTSNIPTDTFTSVASPDPTLSTTTQSFQPPSISTSTNIIIKTAHETSIASSSTAESSYDSASGSISLTTAPTYSVTIFPLETSIAPLPETSEDVSTQKVTKDQLSVASKIGIGVGVPIGIMFFFFLIYYLIKRYGLKRARIINKARGPLPELDRGWQGWLGGKREKVDNPEGTLDQGPSHTQPPSQHSQSHTENAAAEPWEPLSGKESHAFTVDVNVHTPDDSGSRTVPLEVSSFGTSHTESRKGKEKGRPAELEALSSHVSKSHPSPSLFPPLSPANLGGSVSSRTSSMLGWTNFYSQITGHGHERTGSASTKRSNKSRKGSTATMMTSNYDMELATLSSSADQQYPATPRDHESDDKLRVFRYPSSPAFPYFDHDRDAISSTNQMHQSHMSNTQTILAPPKAAKHRHSRTSSSGINVMNFMSGLPSPFSSSPKRGAARPGTSPLASNQNSQTDGKHRTPINKNDIRVIPMRVSFFDDAEDEDDDVQSIRSSRSPRRYSISRRKRQSRNSTGSLAFPKRTSKAPSEEVDGEEVWTDTEEERDSLEIHTGGGLGSRHNTAKARAELTL